MAKGGRKGTTKKIDVEKFKKLLAERNITMVSLSVEMGFASNYISSSIHKLGGISPFAVTYLKNKYGISYNSYKYIKVQPENDLKKLADEFGASDMPHLTPDFDSSSVETVQFAPVDVTTMQQLLSDLHLLTNEEKRKNFVTDLYDVIYKATYEATIDAWKTM